MRARSTAAFEGRSASKKINRDFKSANSDGVIAPAAKFHTAIFERNGYTRGFFMQKIFDAPLYRFFGLCAVLGQGAGRNILCGTEARRQPWAGEGRRRRGWCLPQAHPARRCNWAWSSREQSPWKNKLPIVYRHTPCESILPCCHTVQRKKCHCGASHCRGIAVGRQGVAEEFVDLLRADAVNHLAWLMKVQFGEVVPGVWPAMIRLHRL